MAIPNDLLAARQRVELPQLRIKFNVYAHKKSGLMSSISVMHCDIICIFRVILIAKTINRTSKSAWITMANPQSNRSKVSLILTESHQMHKGIPDPLSIKIVHEPIRAYIGDKLGIFASHSVFLLGRRASRSERGPGLRSQVHRLYCVVLSNNNTVNPISKNLLLIANHVTPP
jgi:hypothetical protein